MDDGNLSQCNLSGHHVIPRCPCGPDRPHLERKSDQMTRNLHKCDYCKYFSSKKNLMKENLSNSVTSFIFLFSFSAPENHPRHSSFHHPYQRRECCCHQFHPYEDVTNQRLHERHSSHDLEVTGTYFNDDHHQQLYFPRSQMDESLNLKGQTTPRYLSSRVNTSRRQQHKKSPLLSK